MTVPHKFWTQEKNELLEQHYFARGGEWIAEQLGCSVVSVRSQARRLGVKADPHRKNPRKATKRARELRAIRAVTGRKSPYAPSVVIPTKGFVGEPIITEKTRVTVAPPFVDRRWVVEKAERVVDSGECREWASRL